MQSAPKLASAVVLLFSGFGSASSVPFLVLGLTFLILGNDEKKKVDS